MTLPMRIDAGRLRHRIQIQQDSARGTRARLDNLTESPQLTVPKMKTDNFGEPKPQWSTVGTRWGDIEPTGGREFWYAGQMVSDSSHVVLMRFYPGLTPQMRLLVKGKQYEIVHVINPGQQGFCTIQ